MNHPARPLVDTSIVAALSNAVLNYGPTAITILGGILGMAYYGYLIYDLWDRRRNRQKAATKRKSR